MTTSSRWQAAAHSLAANVGNIAGRAVVAKDTRRGAIGFRAPKVFAYARGRSLGTILLISSKLEWAEKAGAAGTASYTTEKGWWGLPHIAWKVDVEDHGRLQELARILARVMRARHL